MITLSIGLGTSSAGRDEGAHRKIIFGHFRFYNVSTEQAKEGLRHCPGFAIVMPHHEQESFSIDGEPLVLPPGAALVLNGESRNVLVLGNDSELEPHERSSLGVIEINATFNDSFRLRDALETPFWLNSHDSGKVADIYHDLIYSDHATQLPSDSNDISIHLAAARIANLLLNATDEFPKDQIGGKGGAQRDRLRRYLLANLSNKITTTDMATHLGLTRTHFCKRAKSLLGEAPMSYLRRIRLERSLELLEHTAESVDDVAFDIGYADRFSFSKEFKRQYGFSPVQYRKRSGTTLRDDAYLKAKALFDSHRHEQALSVCERALRKAGSDADLDRIAYLQGRCLFVLGRSDDALLAWHSLEGGNYAWQAGIQRCRLYFQNNHFDNALAEFGTLWGRADGLKRNDVIQTWIEQVNALMATHRIHYLHGYLGFRKENFVADQQSKMAAVHACRSTGDTMLILQHCLDDDPIRFRALRGAGEYEQILVLYGSQLGQSDLARVHLEAGHLDEVLALNPGVPKYSARALVELGRPDEAVERFPEECVEAYLVLEQYQEILDHTPEPCYEKVYALHALGRMDEAKTFCRTGDWFWHLTRLYLRPEDLLKVDYPQSHLFVSTVRLLLSLQPGNTPDDTLRHLQDIPRIDTNNFWPAAKGSVDILLRHVIPAFLGDGDSLQSALDAILSAWRFFDKQRLYHDAAYLAGEIDLDTWRQQPFQDGIVPHERFLQSLQYDLDDRSMDARHGYQSFIDSTTIYGLENLFRYRFAEWRLSSLGLS